MRDYKTIFAAVALGLSILIIGLFTMSVFNYIAFLKEQNYTRLDTINSSISQLKSSVASLEAQVRFQELMELKNENILLRRQADKLREKLRSMGAPEEKDKAGNRGYVQGRGQ